MVNDLKAFESLSKEEIMRMTGQDDGSVISTGTLSRLTINRSAEDDDGNQLSAGVYTVYDSAIESKVYSIKDTPIQFRPFINAFQYMEYDPDENTYPCTSVIFKSWKDEPIDSNGGIRCGKVIGKDKENLTQALAKSPALRAKRLGEIYPEDDFLNKHLKFYSFLKTILNMEHSKFREYRRHVALVVDINNCTAEANIDNLTNCEKFVHKFYNYAREKIDPQPKEEE